MTNFFYFNYAMPTQLFILKTNIRSSEQIERIRYFFENSKSIVKWSLDTEDIDNVLKIEATANLDEGDIINQIKSEGFYCDRLPD
ncbi:hypothetical protein H7U19_03985 [Hyunsoonleella sp. SJ7]|uniref:Copper chaperone n=1 Tax=Hyunsoonleella aquatilis TaxID=2762758 RepID=A0A923H7X3_9FLAO|nr:hypothetical protein [Hyunsoonleella aquatilis]MBC3757548.1 hypothetical protein [Hyunsoonleella aquatilis]